MDWEEFTSFCIELGIISGKVCPLLVWGINTLDSESVTRRKLGSRDNMARTWRFLKSWRNHTVAEKRSNPLHHDQSRSRQTQNRFSIGNECQEIEALILLRSAPTADRIRTRLPITCRVPTTVISSRTTSSLTTSPSLWQACLCQGATAGEVGVGGGARLEGQPSAAPRSGLKSERDVYVRRPLSVATISGFFVHVVVVARGVVAVE